MLDVDGNVVDKGQMLERVDQLMAAIAANSAVSSPAARHAETTLDAPVHAMRVLHQELHPPVISSAGPKGKVTGTVKKVIRRLTSWYVEPRWQIEEQLETQHIAFASSTYNAIARIDRDMADLRRRTSRLAIHLQLLTDRLDEIPRDEARLHALEQHSVTQEQLAPLRVELQALLKRLGAIGATGAEIDYAAFEDRFRGDSATLAASQERYLSLFRSDLPGEVLDIGCGRGEMLALLEREGHAAIGIDLSDDMVERCRARGLRASKDDALHFLGQRDDHSLKGIFCAQVVEHLLTPELEALVREAKRTLVPGGILVMETINPRSSFALGNHFYADTSHVRPVHPETLRFLCEQVGFSDVALELRSPHETLALVDQLPNDPTGSAISTLLESVFGYQDYIIVATA